MLALNKLLLTKWKVIHFSYANKIAQIKVRPCILIEWIGLLMSSYTTETKDKPMLAWSLLILFSYCCIYTIFKLEAHEALNTG